MPERWERELSKLRGVEVPDADVRKRIEGGPRSSEGPPRHDRVLAALVAVAVAVVAGGFLWRTLPGTSEGVGDPAAALPTLIVTFQQNGLVVDEPDQQIPRVDTTIVYGDAREESFTSALPANDDVNIHWVAAEDLTPFVPGPTVGSAIDFQADGVDPRVLLGRPTDWPNFDRFTRIDRLPEEPGQYVIVFQADYPGGIARTARRIHLVQPNVLQLVADEGGDARSPATASAYVDGRGAKGFLSEHSSGSGDLGTGSTFEPPHFDDSSWLDVPSEAGLVLATDVTTSRYALFEPDDRFDSERLTELGDLGTTVEGAGRRLLAVELTWIHPAPGSGDVEMSERAVFFFPIEIATEPVVEEPAPPTPSPAPVAQGAVAIDIRRSSEETGDPEAYARLGGQEVWMCPDGWSLVNPDGTTDGVVFDCGQSDELTAPAGTPIVVSGDFGSVEATARLSGTGDRTEFAPDQVPAVEPGSVVYLQWSVSWDDGSTASFWLLLTVADEPEPAEAGVLTISVEDDTASLTFGGHAQKAIHGDGYIAEDGEVVQWFERAPDVTDYVRVPRGAQVEVVTPGGSVRSFAIGRPLETDGYWIMIDSGSPAADVLASEELGPVRYVIEVLVEREDGTWSDAYFGIELFAPVGGGAVTVPNVVGLSQQEAEEILREAGLSVEVKEVSLGLPAGEVWRSQPPPGSVVFPDVVVTLQTSSGTEGG